MGSTLFGAVLLSLLGSHSAVAGQTGLPPAEDPASAEPLRSVTVPVALDHNRMIVEVEFIRPDATIRKARAWVDTGSQYVMMAQPLARDLGIDIPGSTGAERSAESAMPAPPVRLGGMPLRVEGVQRRVQAGTCVLPGVLAETTLPASLFRQDHVVFDYPARLLTVARPGVLNPRGVGVPCRVNAETGLFLVAATVDGDTVRLGIDNGSAGTWVSDTLTAAWEIRHPDWPHATGAVGSANFFGFPFETHGTLMRLPEMALGAVRARNVGLLGLGQDLFDWYSRKSAGPVLGFIGANVLKGFRLEIDFPNQMTYWEAGPPADRNDFDIVGLTLRAEPDSNLTIAGVVMKNGQPAVEGVQPGDKLIRVDGLDTAHATMGTVVDALRGTPGSTRSLVLERGGKRFTIKAKTLQLP
jgi:hypothetical protein